jgi:signal transduction histidine kinase/FixJ family two-component response regulator
MLSKLRSAIVLAVVVGLLIPVSVSSFLTLGQRQDALTQRMLSDHERLTSILALGMQEPLWNLNPNGGRPLLESMLSDKRIVAVIVNDNLGREFLSRSHPERRQGGPGRQLMLVKEVRGPGNEVIGRVKLEMDTGQLESEVASERQVFAWTVVGQLLLSVVLIVALLQRRVLGPIERLMGESGRLAERDLGTPFVWESKDELGRLGASLERTRRALKSLFGEIEAKNQLLEDDIRKRVATEQELQRHRDHLEELVRERTRELLAAKERADVANQAKSTFLSSMTHELRTPLNAILGYAQILAYDKGLTERQTLGLKTIQQSGEHLLTLITDLLDLAKIESGKFELLPERITLRPFLDSIVDIIRVRAEQKNLQFRFTPAADLPAVALLDEKRLRQVLLNLLGNAVKFTDSGHVELKVSAANGPAGQAHLRFDIEDTGVGMGHEQLQNIFKPFEQVGDMRRRAGGTGLGLSISQQLVRLMGSDIQVASDPGQGSRFSFELLVPVDGSEIAVPSARRVELAYEGPPKKALIVDDVPANRELLKDLLGELGFEVYLATNGEEGVRRAKECRPDIVFMDIAMPVMDGMEATRRIRQMPQTERTPVIAVSASVAREDQEGMARAGANAFVGKPIDRNVLVQKIGACLDLPWVQVDAPEEAKAAVAAALAAASGARPKR